MSLDLQFGGDALQFVEYLLQIEPRLTRDRAERLSQAISAVGNVSGDPIELSAWLLSATKMAAECSDDSFLVTLEVLQDRLKQLGG